LNSSVGAAQRRHSAKVRVNEDDASGGAGQRRNRVRVSRAVLPPPPDTQSVTDSSDCWISGSMDSWMGAGHSARSSGELGSVASGAAALSSSLLADYAHLL
jgi:hypothetical protein